MYHQTPLDPRINLFATAWADQLIAGMDQTGVAITAANNRALLAHLSQTLFRIARQREHEALDHLHKWVTAAGLLSPHDAARHLSLTAKEFQRACHLRFICPVGIPQEIQGQLTELPDSARVWYAPTISLTPAQQAEVRDGNLLSRYQAAKRLHISEATFDQLQAAQHLQPAKIETSRYGQPRPLYRLDEIDQILTHRKVR